MEFDVIVLGGGAAGIFSAIFAARRGKSVLIIEKNPSVGKKILISGGGRCNFTNLSVSYKNFYGQNINFSRSALSQFNQDMFIDFVKNSGIDFYEKKMGQLFCRNSSQDILNLLCEELEKNKVQVEVNCIVSSCEKLEIVLRFS